MAFASRKWPAVLCDYEIGDCLLDSESEESLSDSECDNENEFDDCAVLNVVVNGESDQDDTIQDFLWGHEQLQGTKGKIHQQCWTSRCCEASDRIVDVFILFFNRAFIAKIAEETNRYAKQFLWGGGKLSSKSHARSWKPVTEEEIYIVLGLFMLMGIIQKPTLRSCFITRRVISTRIWRCYNKRQT
jgi:hypothetical protein